MEIDGNHNSQEILKVKSDIDIYKYFKKLFIFYLILYVN
jgi:hypothetical protein